MGGDVRLATEHAGEPLSFDVGISDLDADGGQEQRLEPRRVLGVEARGGVEADLLALLRPDEGAETHEHVRGRQSRSRVRSVADIA